MPFAPSLLLPLRQHIGRPAVPVVREGEEVERGQLLARAEGEGSLPLHAPATGYVVSIAERSDPAGGTVRVVRLDPLPGDTQEYPCGAGCDPQSASPDELLGLIRDAGVVDLDGEATATHARLAAARAAGTGTLVLNGIDSDPVFRGVSAILRAHRDDVCLGTRCLARILGVERLLLMVEQPDGEAARALVAAFSREPRPMLEILAPRYPQGAEELLLRRLSHGPGKGESAPAPALCVGIATVAEIGGLLVNGHVMTDQVVTLAGGALDESGHYRVPLGTPLSFALEQAGMSAAPASVLQGGMMRGDALASLEQPITKGATGYVALAEGEAPAAERALPCIRCGECIAVCPVQLNPAELGLLARRDMHKVMHEEYGLDICLECGCCSYVCPSRIPLVQLFRAARAQWRRPGADLAGGGAH
jgi:electron transport complex protein RnfC